MNYLIMALGGISITAYFVGILFLNDVERKYQRLAKLSVALGTVGFGAAALIDSQGAAMLFTIEGAVIATIVLALIVILFIPEAKK